ncbi:MAG: cytochrome c-type biogenesis protein [Pseudomonadota bacterium]|nr:cytochrome c-type biogenesis protein [Pseudomonadota bacterium]
MKKIVFILILFTSSVSFAVDNNPTEFVNAQQAMRYQVLTEKLRCVVCQNQSVADSNAELAQDIRELVRQKILQGQTDAEITDFLVERYGDFVLYEPPLKPKTYLLWLGPAVLFFSALLTLIYFLFRHAKSTQKPPTLSAAEQEKLQQILEEK